MSEVCRDNQSVAKMRYIKYILLSVLFLTAVSAARAEKSYDVAEFYSVEKAPSGTKAVGEYDKTVDVKFILTPTRVDTGKFIVKVKKIGDNLYQIKDSDICVETRYCHEWISYYEEVVLIVESNYGYKKGKIIFD